MNQSNNPRVLIQTELGDMLLELYIQQAPVTVQNFLHYIQEERFAQATFHRVVRMNNQPNDEHKIEVVQGGLKDDHHPLNLPPIPHETTKQTGILHTDGIISMARDEPSTVTSDFFICIGDQPELDFGGGRNPDGQGFAAFGKVIHGMDVVHKIHQSPTTGQNLEPNIPILGMRIVN
jgi:peptidyl-prolyl cis-trans isomerase A (cyclophilin A)